MISIKWLVNIPITQSVNRHTVLDRSVYELTAKYAFPAIRWEMHMLQLHQEGMAQRYAAVKTWVTASGGRHNLTWGGISINYFPRELDLTFGGNIKSLTLMVLLVVLFSNISLLGAIKTQEELWWNWFWRTPKFLIFSQQDSLVPLPSML